MLGCYFSLFLRHNTSSISFAVLQYPARRLHIHPFISVHDIPTWWTSVKPKLCGVRVFFVVVLVTVFQDPMYRAVTHRAASTSCASRCAWATN